MKNLKNLSKRTLALAMALLMCVGMLNLTAFAAEKDTYICGHEAHVHTDECYSWPELICGQEEAEAAEASEGHTHSADCYEMRTVNVEKKELVCDLEESEAVEASEGHTHTDACYEAGEDVLVCGEEESEDHTHTDACYEAGAPELACGQEESEAVEGSEGHTHTDDCYETKIYEVEEETLICGKEESEAVEASEGHTHTDACYEGEKTLICDKEEHTHTAECLAEVTPEDKDLEDEDTPETEDEENPEEEELIPEIALLNLEEEDPEEEDLEFVDLDLKEYFENYDVNGSITINATDMNNEAVEEFVVGNKYFLTLNIYADAFKPGDYSYQLPDFVEVVNQLKDEIKDGDDVIGEWSIYGTGKVSLHFNKEARYSSEVTAHAQVTVRFEETSDPNPMLGNIEVVINSPVVRAAALAKDGSQNLSNTSDQALYWKIEFTGGTPGSGQQQQIVGKTLKDTTDGKHGFTSLVEFGVRIEGKDHTWLVGPENATLTTNDKGYPIGWSYVIPHEITCKECGKTIQLDDSYVYWACYFSNPIGTAKEESETYHNEVRIEDTNLWDDDDVTLTFKYGGAVVSKRSGNYNANGQKFAKEWTIDVAISGVPADGTKYPAYSLWDHFVIEDANKNEIANFKDSFDQFAQDFKVTIDGTEVPSVVEAWLDGCQSEYAYLRTGGNILIGMRYDATDLRHNCSDDADRQLGEDGKGYCTCWREEDPTTVTITYHTDDDKMLELMAQYGKVGMRLVNYIDVNTRLNIEKPEYKWMTKDDATALLDGVFDKEQGTTASVPVGSEVDYTITLNESNYVLEDEQLCVEDKMTGLVYVDGSIKVTSTSEGGQTSALSPNDYKVAWDAESTTLTITLLNTNNTSNCYTVEYKTKVVGDANGKAQYSNSASVKMFGQTFERKVTPDGNGSIGSTSKGFSITVLKTETGNSTVKLAGAVFGLYNAQKNELMTTGTTGANGTLVFRTNTSGNKMVILKEHTPYYIQEVTAPSGYVKDDARHYFYFCKEGGEDCKACEALKETLDGIKEASETPIAFECYPAGATVTVENEKIPVTDERVYSVKLTKVDAKTRATLNGAVFGLFQGVQNADNSAIATATTDGNGICTFNSQNEYKLTAHTLYYLQELTAPSGYELNSDPHYFYFCDHAGSDEDTCDACGEMENAVGAKTVKELEFGITVENTKKEGGDPDPGTDPDPKPDTDTDPDPKPNPDPRPNPRPDPEPTPEIPDEDVPLTETPDVEIPEEDVPLADLPEIEDEEVPLADVPEELIEIFDEDVPLANVPKTGDNSQIWGIIAALSGAGLVWLALEEKKRKTAE